MIPTFPTASTPRDRHYGASEVACILGVADAFRTPFEVWAEKTGNATREDLSGNVDIERGNLFEPVILRLMARQLGAELTVGAPFSEPAIINPAVSPYAGCHPDGWLVYADRIEGAEAKAPRRGLGWGDDEDAVPLPYWLQCQTCMALTGIPVWQLGALLYGEVRIHRIAYDPETILPLLARCDAWFERHVVGGEPPPVDSTPAASEYMARRVSSGLSRKATADEADAIRAYLDLGRQIKALETACEALAVQLRQAMTSPAGVSALTVGKSALRPIPMPGRQTVSVPDLLREFPDAARLVKVSAPYVQLRSSGFKE